MHRRFQRFRRPSLVALYLSLLGLWATLAYDTYGLWLGRQQVMARELARAAVQPTSVPAPTAQPATALPLTVTPIATSDPTPTTRPAPTPTMAAPAIMHPKTGRYVAAWLPTSFDADQARASFEANKDILDEISPFWYMVNPVTGQLIPEDGARDREL